MYLRNSSFLSLKCDIKANLLFQFYFYFFIGGGGWGFFVVFLYVCLFFVSFYFVFVCLVVFFPHQLCVCVMMKILSQIQNKYIGLDVLLVPYISKMAKEKKNFDLKEYPFSTEEIPRLNIDNPETEKRIAAGVKLYVLLM